jgi:hypothetical protein
VTLDISQQGEHAMGSNRKHADRRPHGATSGKAPRPSMVGEAQVDTEQQDDARRKLSGPETQTSPRAGRTGGLGSRAERPSENRHRQTTEKPPEPSRSSTAPSSAAGSPAKSSRASDKPGKPREKLPQSVRDSTT